MQEINLKAPNTDPVFALLYGGSGTGKTDFCGTLGELGRVLIIDVDQGWKTLKFSDRLHKASDKIKYTDNLTVVSFDQFKDLNDAYKCVQVNDPAKWTKAFEVKGLKPEEQIVIDKPFDWVVWDSWTELQWHLHKQLRDTKSLALGKDELDFRKNLEIQHWGMLTDLNKLATEQLRACKGCNQLLVCLEGTKEDENTKMITYGPSIHGKLVVEFPGYFDDVLYSYTDIAGKYHITTKPKARWPAKTRLGVGKDQENPYARDFFKLAPKFST